MDAGNIVLLVAIIAILAVVAFVVVRNGRVKGSFKAGPVEGTLDTSPVKPGVTTATVNAKPGNVKAETGNISGSNVIIEGVGKNVDAKTGDITDGSKVVVTGGQAKSSDE